MKRVWSEWIVPFFCKRLKSDDKKNKEGLMAANATRQEQLDAFLMEEKQNQPVLKRPRVLSPNFEQDGLQQPAEGPVRAEFGETKVRALTAAEKIEGQRTANAKRQEQLDEQGMQQTPQQAQQVLASPPLPPRPAVKQGEQQSQIYRAPTLVLRVPSAVSSLKRKRALDRWYVSTAVDGDVKSDRLAEMWRDGEVVRITANVDNIEEAEIFFICDSNHLDKHHHALHGKAVSVIKLPRGGNICLFEGVGNNLDFWCPGVTFDSKYDYLTGWDVAESVTDAAGSLRDALEGNDALQQALDSGAVKSVHAQLQANAFEFAEDRVHRGAKLRNESLKECLRIQYLSIQNVEEPFSRIIVFGGSAHTNDRAVLDRCSALGAKWAALEFKTFARPTMKALSDYYVHGQQVDRD